MLNYDTIAHLSINLNHKEHVLPEKTKSIIKDILKNLNIKQSSFHMEKAKYKCSFKDTSTDVSELVNKSKIILNKMTDKNFEKLFKDLCQVVDDANNNSNDELLNKLSDHIFSIVCKDRLHSKVFSKLYDELCKKYKYMKEYVYEKIDGYSSEFRSIRDVKVENYDDYCEFVRQNDRRIALSVFCAELYKLDLIHLDFIKKMLLDSLNIFSEHIDGDNPTLCEEIIHNVFEICKILYAKESTDGTEGFISRKQNKNKTKCNDDINWLKLDIMEQTNNPELKSGSSFNNKIRFKIMDINDLLK